MNSNDIILTLCTADGCTGNESLATDGAMFWDREPNRETISAKFEEVSPDGKVLTRYAVDGNLWRSIESTERALYWLRRGVPLRAAVSACIDGCDPDGWSSDDEAEMDTMRLQIAALNDQRNTLASGLSALVKACSVHGGSAAAMAADIATARAALAAVR